MKRWTENQISLLKENFIEKGDQYLASIVNKSPNAVRIMASRFGISRLKIRENIKLSNEEEQVLLGTLLGDTYCRIHKPSKSAVIECAHCKEQEPYLLWKISMLKNLSFNLRRTKLGYLFASSRAFPCLNEYHSLFYKNNKKEVNNQILDKINSLGLAIWYMDDGCYGKRDGNSSLHTNGFTYEENALIKNWFEGKFGIVSKIYSVKKENRQIRYYLKFGVYDTKTLIKIIRPYIHPSLKYKIGDGESEKKRESKGEYEKWETDQYKSLEQDSWKLQYGLMKEN